MRAIFTSEVVSRGLDRRSERVCLAACAGLALFYGVALTVFEIADVPYPKVFFAKRDAVRMVHVLDHPLTIGRETALSAGGGKPPPEIALLGGWSDMEPWGVWSEGPLAELAVVVPKDAIGPLVLHVAGVAALDGKHAQRITIAANGVELGHVEQATAPLDVHFAVPAGAIAPSGLVRIAFRIGNPTRLEGSRDPRLLGLALQQISLARPTASR